MAGKFVAEYPDGTGTGPYEGKQHADGGGFSGAVLPEKSVYISLLYAEGKIIDGVDIVESFGKMFYLDDGRHGFVCIKGKTYAAAKS